MTTDTPSVCGWLPPENTYVEVDGKDVQVPEIDELLHDSIIGASESIDHHRDQILIIQWLKSLEGNEVRAGAQYFTDRWTWDTGHPLDQFLAHVFELEAARRRILMREIDRVMSTPEMTERLKRIQEYHDARDKADGNP